MKDFLSLRTDLENQLKVAVYDFFNRRGVPFDGEAWERQSGTNLQIITRDLLMLGADIFPKNLQDGRPTDDA